MPAQTTLEEFMAEAEVEFPGYSSGWFYPVDPALVKIEAPYWEISQADAAVIFMVALTMEAPDGALYAWAIPANLAIPGVFLLRRAFGFPESPWVVVSTAEHPWAVEKRSADFLNFVESFKSAMYFLAQKAEKKMEG